MTKPNIITIGGGTGLSVLLRGLKKLPVNLAAIVTMTDNGASSGRLRRAYGVLPPGDVRQCLVALADDEELLTRLFNYRFSLGHGLSNHNFGNLFLLALTDISGNFDQAVRESSRILAITGQVLPSTLTCVNIGAKLANGNIVLGESDIPILGHRSPIKKIILIPARAKANPDALKAIDQADLILIGPGSLYTSIIPNLLIQGVVKAIVNNHHAKKVYICNVSTERGETEHYGVEDHLNALIYHGHPKLITHCLVNRHIMHANGDEGKLGSIKNITTSMSAHKGIKIIQADLINRRQPLFHDFEKLRCAINRYFL